MIAILCDSFEETQDAFDVFVSFLEKNDSCSIKSIDDASYCVETDDDLKYVFADYRFESLFRTFECVDIINENDFFQNIEECYF